MKRIAVLTMSLALALPGVALAQDAPNALDDTYTSDQRVLGEVGTIDNGSGPSSGTKPAAAEEAAAPVSAAVPADTGSLPFTGFDAALIAGGGLLLLAGGFVLRRIARPQL
jgi:hypothetical protein